jgi:DNA-binding transcriptional MerR regulator
MIVIEESKQYPIRYIAEKTGVKPITLRAWENRYKLVIPQRTEKGHRFYSDEDVDLVQRVVTLLSKGYSISEAVDVVKNYDKYELVGEGKTKHLINFDVMDKAIYKNNISLSVREVSDLYALYSPEAFAQVIYPAIMTHLNQEIWPNISHAEIARDMFMDAVILHLQKIINENNQHKLQKKVIVVGYRTAMIKNLVIHGLLLANILHVHGLNVQFCSGISSKESFKGLEAYDMVIMFGRSDGFYLGQLDHFLENEEHDFYISMVGKQYAMENVTVLSSDYSAIFDQIKV